MENIGLLLLLDEAVRQIEVFQILRGLNKLTQFCSLPLDDVVTHMHTLDALNILQGLKQLANASPDATLINFNL